MTLPLLLLLTIFTPLVGAVVVLAMARFEATSDRATIRWTALAFTLLAMAGATALIVNFPSGPKADKADNFAVIRWPWLESSAVEVGEVVHEQKNGRQAESSSEQVELRSAPLGFNIEFHIGLDGLSLWLFGLSALLMVTSILVSWRAITRQAPLFYAMLLLLEFGCLGVFAARDILLFYVFFEFTLIPLFFLIGIWGSEERRYAAIKFFLFTLAGSLLTFLGLLAIAFWGSGRLGADSATVSNSHRPLTFSIPDLTEQLAARQRQSEQAQNQYFERLVFIALLIGFAVKVPLVPVHTWLPLAHVQAPTAGSVFLAGILLKIGTYGLVRFNLMMLPAAAEFFAPYLLLAAVVGIIYGALVALAQTDIKRLIAYSSVSHMGFCVLGLFALNPLGVQGGALQMINHGISTGALFALVGMLYERYHTRRIQDLGGLSRRTPILAFFMVLFTMSSIGLPGLNGFAGEFLLLLGMFQRAFIAPPAGWEVLYPVLAVAALSGVVLGAWYMLWLVQRVFFGPLKEPPVHESSRDHSDDEQGDENGPVDLSADLSAREVFALAPLAALVIWIGLQPKFFLDRMAPTLDPAAFASSPQLDLEPRPQTASAGRR